jgi:hypothetical protein
MTKAEQLGDIAGNISFATWLANGMSLHGMADRAVPVIDNAMELARKSGYPEIPLELSIAKVRALTNLPEPKADQNRDAAEKLIASTIAQAEKQHVLGAQTELLNETGQMAVKKGNLPAAERAFRQAVDVSMTAALPREEAEACLHLSQFYRATNQPAKAAAEIDRGIRSVQAS